MRCSVLTVLAMIRRVGSHNLGPVTAGYYSRQRPEVVALVPAEASRILDVGCGDGAVGAALRREGRTVIGMERVAPAVETASRRLDHVEHVDLDDGEALRAAMDRTGPIDCLIVADVLEHLTDPWSALDVLVDGLEPGGIVVLSLPNLRVISTTLPLVVHGRFRYADHGVRDRTHLRFFTRESIIELVCGAGLVILSLDRAPTPWRSGWRAFLARFLKDFGNEQFLVSARKP